MDTIRMADGVQYELMEYLMHIVCRSNGQRTAVTKKRLSEMCLRYDIPVCDEDTKEDLFIALFQPDDEDLSDEEYDMFLIERAEELGVGLSSSDYQHTFGISHSVVQKAEQDGVLQVVGYITYQSYGKEQKSPMYSIKQFYEHSWGELKKIFSGYQAATRSL